MDDATTMWIEVVNGEVWMRTSQASTWLRTIATGWADVEAPRVLPDEAAVVRDCAHRLRAMADLIERGRDVVDLGEPEAPPPVSMADPGWARVSSLFGWIALTAAGWPDGPVYRACRESLVELLDTTADDIAAGIRSGAFHPV